MMEQVTTIILTRQERFLAWLKRNNLRMDDLAESLNTCRSNISRMIYADTIPVRRHEQLVGLGVPADLLPAPLDVKPGPKRRISPIIPNNPDLPALPR